MNEMLARYHDPLVLIPMAAMFVIIFVIVHRSLREMDMFPAGSRLVIGLCVTVLAMYGMDQTVIRVVVSQYTAMGVAMLFGLAVLLLTVWIGLSAQTRKRIARSQRDDEEDA